MTSRVAITILAGSLGCSAVSEAQQALAPGQERPLASKYIDTVTGLTLDDAIARALEREPALRASRGDVEVARGMRLQAELRPNPTMTLSQQNDPNSTDYQTSVSLQWPLDLFRQQGRIAVADREIEAAEQSVANRTRLLAGEVRMMVLDKVRLADLHRRYWPNRPLDSMAFFRHYSICTLAPESGR